MCILWAHGALIWKLLLAVWTGIGFALWLRVRRARILAARRAALESLQLRVRPVAVGVEHVRGVWREDGEARWLECAEIRVELDGAVEAGGARPGDEVIAEGAVARDGERWSIGPRVLRGPAWWSGPAGPGARLRHAHAVGLHGLARPRAVPRIGVLAAMLALAVSAGVGYGALHWVGSASLAAMRNAPLELQPLSWGAVAAAMPGSRADALHDATRRLAEPQGYQADIVTEQLALAEVVGDCDAQIDIALRRNELDEAVRKMMTCRREDEARHLRVDLGEYEQPDATLASAPWPVGAAAIAGGRWAEAAVAADTVAARTGAARYTCLADWFRALDHDDDARRRLSSRDTARTDDVDDTCALLSALARPHVDRLEALDVLVRRGSLYQYEIAQALLDIEDDRELSQDSNRGGDRFSGEHFAPRGLFWLGRWAHPEELGGARRDRALQLRMGFEMYGRDPGAALRELDAPRVAYDERSALAAAWLADEVAFLVGALPRTAPELRLRPDEWDARLGLPAKLDMFGESAECRGRSVDAFARAQAGDGASLADLLSTCHVYDDRSMILAVLPRVHTHRRELAIALRTWNSPGTDPAERNSVFGFLAVVRDRRDLAALVGDDESVARWQAILDRQAAVFADKDRLIAMILWQ